MQYYIIKMVKKLTKAEKIKRIENLIVKKEILIDSLVIKKNDYKYKLEVLNKPVKPIVRKSKKLLNKPTHVKKNKKGEVISYKVNGQVFKRL